MPFMRLGPETIAIFIPIVAIFGGIMIAIVAIIVAGRNKDLAHRERLIALEKGIPLPEPPEVQRKPVHAGRRANGLVMTGIGLALFVALWLSNGLHDAGWALIPLFIGIGLLVASFLDKREYDSGRHGKTPPPDGPEGY